MRNLSAKSQKWLKCLHIFFASVWVGCTTVLVIVQLFIKPDNGGELHGIVATLDFIDLFILIPGAIGTFLTALIYSIWTNWGWFKHFALKDEGFYMKRGFSLKLPYKNVLG